MEPIFVLPIIILTISAMAISATGGIILFLGNIARCFILLGFTLLAIGTAMFAIFTVYYTVC